MSLKEKAAKLKRIAEGWKNFIFTSPSVEALAKGRAEICASCPFAIEGKWLQNLGDEIIEIEGLKCEICNCPLSAKTRSIKEECPHPDGDKWVNP